MITQLFGFISKVIRVNADTMAADKSRSEPQRVLLRIHAVNNFIRIDFHLIKHHGELVHESDINVALTVLDHLDRLCRFDRRNRICSDLNIKIIDIFDLFKRFFIHAGNDLTNVFQTMDLITGIDTFGRTSDLEIKPAFQP